MCSMFFDMNQKLAPNLKQMQRLIMSPQMQQAINMMQMPVLELSTVIQNELEQNPILEYHEEKPDEGNNETNNDEETPPEQELCFKENDLEILKRLDEDFREHFSESGNYYIKRTAEEEKLKTFLEQSIPQQETLFEHLMVQSREAFETKEELSMAEAIIGNFDESGFLQTPLEEITSLNNFRVSLLKKVLLKIQTFDPFGVGGRDLQESFLIQLRCHKKKDTLAYKIIEMHFDDLLHNRIPKIQKGLQTSAQAIREDIEHQILHLDFHPGTLYSNKVVQYIIPDVTLRQDEDQLSVIINDESLPTLRLNSRYLRMLDDEKLPKETKDFVRNKLVSAKWLLKNIDQRNETITRVVTAIAKWQRDFFLEPDGKLVPLTMKTLAEELDIHESTVARAVAKKYVDSPRGILPLRFFFSNAYTTAEGDDISSKTVREVLKKIIDEENKKRPLSDESISKLLEKKGVNCARRTVAKYRSEMKIGNANQRKQY